jgi:hypothetical protein
MASFDFGNTLNVQVALSTRQVTANTNASAVDTNGYEGASFKITSGTANVLNALAGFTLSFTEGDDTNTLNSTAVASDRILRTATVNAANTVAWSSVANTKRYVFPHVRFAGAQGAASNAFITVEGILGIPHSAPTT